MLIKKCSKCRKLKEITKFRLRSNNFISQCKDCEREYLNEWELLNKNYRLYYKKKLKREKRELYNFYERKRKFKIRGNNIVGSHSFEDWINLKNKKENKCLRCGKSEPEVKLTGDHIIPISKRGTDYIENIQPLCIKCNQIKNNREWRFI